jgi:hypothetical protein
VLGDGHFWRRGDGVGWAGFDDFFNHRLRLEDGCTLTELTLADGVYAIGCGGLGGLVLGGRRNRSGRAQLGTVFSAMACLRFMTAGPGAPGFVAAGFRTVGFGASARESLAGKD